MAYVNTKLNQLPIFVKNPKEVKKNNKLVAFKSKFITVVPWGSDELNFEEDLKDLESLSISRKILLACTLIFFKDGDRIIINNCVEGFPSIFDNNDIELPFLSYEDRTNAIEWYAFQTANEKVHNISYNDAINTYFKANKEFRDIFIEVEPLMLEKLKILEKYVNKSIEDTPISSEIKDEEQMKLTLAKNMLNFLMVEAIGFHSNFALIFYFKSLNIMHTLTKQNNFIHRDEGYHAKFALMFMILHKLNNILTKDYIKDTIDTFVQVEIKFLDTIVDILTKYYYSKKSEYTLTSLSINGLKIYLKDLGNRISYELCNEIIYEDLDLALIPSYISIAETSNISNGIEINSNSYVKVKGITKDELLLISQD